MFALCGKGGLYAAETTGEFRIRPAQCLFGINAQVTGQIGDHEQDVAHLVADFVFGQLIASLNQFSGFFLQFI